MVVVAVGRFCVQYIQSHCTYRVCPGSRWRCSCLQWHNGVLASGAGMESLRTHQHHSECTFIAECLAGKLDISAGPGMGLYVYLVPLFTVCYLSSW